MRQHIDMTPHAPPFAEQSPSCKGCMCYNRVETLRIRILRTRVQTRNEVEHAHAADGLAGGNDAGRMLGAG
jgi:hypothetical protein